MQAAVHLRTDQVLARLESLAQWQLADRRLEELAVVGRANAVDGHRRELRQQHVGHRGDRRAAEVGDSEARAFRRRVRAEQAQHAARANAAAAEQRVDGNGVVDVRRGRRRMDDRATQHHVGAHTAQRAHRLEPRGLVAQFEGRARFVHPVAQHGFQRAAVADFCVEEFLEVGNSLLNLLHAVAIDARTARTLDHLAQGLGAGNRAEGREAIAAAHRGDDAADRRLAEFECALDGPLVAHPALAQLDQQGFDRGAQALSGFLGATPQCGVGLQRPALQSHSHKDSMRLRQFPQTSGIC